MRRSPGHERILGRGSLRRTRLSPLKSYCATTPITARERGYESLLAVTSWGHVSRVRLYFQQCFDGDVYVTDTPRPLSKSRKDALLHETGGYLKAFLTPAC